MNCVGIGYDVHRLMTGRKLILGGIEIPHDRGLDGHSDADVGLHALTDEQKRMADQLTTEHMMGMPGRGL